MDSSTLILTFNPSDIPDDPASFEEFFDILPLSKVNGSFVVSNKVYDIVHDKWQHGELTSMPFCPDNELWYTPSETD